VGDVVRGKACRAANFGVFIELAEGVEGLCHNSEIPGAQEHKKDEPPLEMGREYDFKIIKMSEAEKKIGLSIRALGEDEERTRLEEYQRRATAATLTIEEVMNLKGQGTLAKDETEPIPRRLPRWPSFGAQGERVL
jgi:small subunit ribosomal protein S1